VRAACTLSAPTLSELAQYTIFHGCPDRIRRTRVGWCSSQQPTTSVLRQTVGRLVATACSRRYRGSTHHVDRAIDGEHLISIAQELFMKGGFAYHDLGVRVARHRERGTKQGDQIARDRKVEAELVHLEERTRRDAPCIACDTNVEYRLLKASRRQRTGDL